MACGSGDGENKCSSAWESLCSYIGSLCIDLETVIGGLIRNQETLRDKIEVYDSRAIGIPECTNLYLEAGGCTITTTPTDTTIPYGSHIGGGWIQSFGNVICGEVGNAGTGVSPSACDPVDSSFQVITEDGITPYAYLLENATSGCTKMIINTVPCCDEPKYILGYNHTYVPRVVQPINTPLVSPLTLTVPRSGWYNVNARILIEGSDGFSVHGYLTRNGVRQILQFTPTAQGDGTGDFFAVEQSRHMRFDVGDIITLEAEKINGAPFTIAYFDLAMHYLDATLL